MADPPETLPHRARGVSVQTLRVEVLEGPDAGATATADETLEVGTAEGSQLKLTDPTVSRYHLELSTVAKGIRVQDLGSKNGTVVNGVRLERGVTLPDSVIQLGRTKIRVSEAGSVDVEFHAEDGFGSMRGATPLMRRLFARLEKLAPGDTPVLLVGESGTGKEVVARAIHERGDRADKPFVTVDCAAMAPNLVASELFGHERGAFTGAEKRTRGAFERAHGGTIFLDELGELPLELQPALLGVLERRQVRRVGGDEDVDIDVRVLAATNRDLRAEVNSGTFRLDLYHRVAVVTERIPPLRDRPDDIPLLIQHFLRECGEERPMEVLFADETLGLLQRHRWPGNVRELRNVVEVTAAIGVTPAIDPPAEGEVGGDGGEGIVAGVLGRPYKEARHAVLTDFETRYLKHLIDQTGGNASKAARVAGIDRSYLLNLLRRHGLR